MKIILSLLVAACLAGAAVAQQPPSAPQPSAAATAPTVVIPGYWDPRRRSERVDLTRVPQIRFLTEEDYPPFNYAGPDGTPVGFNIDLARAICEELGVPCTVQVRRFDTLTDSLDRNAGDAIIASLAITPDIRRRYEVSDRYLDQPARFVMRRETRLADATPEALAGRSIAVVAGTAHEAYLRAFYRQSAIRTHATLAEAQKALSDRDVDALFADGITLAFWLNGTTSADCCRFLGAAFNESRFFGDGLAVVMRRGNEPLRTAINHALRRIWEKGIYADLYLKAFPVGIY
ncbi:transporter substrate-binding domain-containing protein [Phreatobacter sp.]|uniref:transporter substrate-binding domain-containing protein n=1 Tax=Phreatobacter sp. TaxID=1966341 RepID=UPI003F718CAD